MENENPYKNLLEIGKIYKYEELCNAVGEDKKGGGNSKQAQIKRWKRHFLWNHPISKRTGKPSKKFEIIEIYDVPLEVEDRRYYGLGGRPRARFNEYKICGDYTEIYIGEERKVCLIDTEDLDLVQQERKYYVLHGNVCSYDGVWIHRLIMGLPKLSRRLTADDMMVHHINGNSFDNRKCNLRIITKRENAKINLVDNRGLDVENETIHMEEYWIYGMQDGNRYIRTYDKELANAIKYISGVRYHSGTFENRKFYSFTYSEDLKILFKKLETMKNTNV